MVNFKKISNKSFIIAEVGQNHQGNLELAKKYIEVFAAKGADAIKFQTRNNKELFSKDAYNKEYSSEHAFAKTYGHHREKLELSFRDLTILKKLCKKNKVKFMSTPFDLTSARKLKKLGIDVFKISSFDLGNLPLINLVAKMRKPIVLSTGGGKIKEIKESVKILKKNNANFSVLHCVSEYPCNVENLGLEKISKLKKLFPKVCIGLSDHFNGILSGPIAYMKGARVFEKHVTFNRSWKGTDHNFSTEPEGFRKFVRDIRRVTKMMKEKNVNRLGKEKVFLKLGKSIVANRNLKSGKKIKIEDLNGIIFNRQYIPIRESHSLIGKKLKVSIKKGEIILRSYVK